MCGSSQLSKISMGFYPQLPVASLVALLGNGKTPKQGRSPLAEARLGELLKRRLFFCFVLGKWGVFFFLEARFWKESL